MLQEIIEHSKDRLAILILDGMIRLHNGHMVPKNTTRGWDRLLEWKYGYSRWMPLKDLKAYNPVELAKYVAVTRIYIACL